MRECSSRKTRHRSAKDAEVGAHAFARKLNASGQLVQDLYTYRCTECHNWHLTRERRFAGQENLLVHVAAPEALQRWAIGDGA